MSEPIFIPCRVIPVDLTVGPNEGLSPIEKLVLEAIHAGVADVHSLADLFFLGQRPMLDLLWDLWRRTHITIELRTASVSLSEEVQARIANGTLDELDGGETSERPERVLQETLSGHLLRWQRRPRLTTDSRIVPTRALDDGELPIRREELIGVLERVAPQDRADARTERDVRVLGVSVSRAQAMSRSEQVLVELTVEPSIDPSSGCLSLPITGPTELSSVARLDMQRALERLAEEMPSQPWLKQLREKVRQVEAKSEPDLLALVSALADDFSAATVDESKIQDEHDRRCSSAGAVLERVNRAFANRVFITPLRTVGDHVETLSALFRSATRQVVVSAPELDFGVIAGIEPVLRRRLQENVRVLVIWGRSHGASLRNEVANSLDAILAETSGELVWPHSSSRTGSSFAIQDDRQVLVTSESILGPIGSQPHDGTSAGLLVRSHDENTTGYARDLLWWSRRRCSESVIGAMVEVFNPMRPPTPVGLPTLPSPPTSSPEPALARSSTQLWQQSWSAFGSQLRQAVRDLGWWAEPVLDVQHRAQLWSLLRRRSRFTVIYSRRLNVNVTNQPFFDALREKLRNGSRVVLGYHEISPQGTERADMLEEAIAGLQREFPALFQRQRIGSGIEFAADDTSILLSSFRLLSDADEAPTAASGWRRPVHTGLLVRHAGAADSVAPILRAWGVPDHVFDARVEPEPSIAPPAVVAATGVDLQPLLNACGKASNEVERGVILRDWFTAASSADDAWRALRTLDDVKFPFLEAAAAACIWSRRLDTAGDRDRWLAWLAEQAWGRESMVEASILLGPTGQGGHAGRLPASIVHLAAAYELHDETMADGLVEAALEADLESARTGLLALGTLELLNRGSAKADGALEVLLESDAAPDAVRNLATAARSFFAATRAALPVAEIRAKHDSSGREAETEQRYQLLLQSLADAENLGFKFDLGTRTWAALFSETGPLGQLKVKIHDRDREGVDAFLRTHGHQRPDAERLIDEETARTARKTAAWLGTDSRLMGGKRTVCVSRVAQVFHDAHAWALLAGGASVALDANMVAAIASLATSFRTNLDALSEPTAGQRIEAPILRIVLTELSVLKHWS